MDNGTMVMTVEQLYQDLPEESKIKYFMALEGTDFETELEEGSFDDFLKTLTKAGLNVEDPVVLEALHDVLASY